MKIAVLYGSMPQNDFGLTKVLKIIRDTLGELSVETDEINMAFAPVPFFDGIKSQAADDVARRLRGADGLVLAGVARLFAPTAMLQAFIEYLQLDEYADVFREKHCFLAAVSQNGGERAVLEYLSRVVQFMGGFDSASVGLQEVHTQGLETDADLREMIERETEDFYRCLRQNRKRVIPRDYPARDRVAGMTGADVVRLGAEAPEQRERVPVAQVVQKLKLDDFTEQQESDIQELTRFFAEKYAAAEPDDEPPEAPRPVRALKVVPRERSVRQMTQSLPHYFQPQLSNGLSAVLQFQITGAEIFEGHLKIQSTECEYQDGAAEAPDITIIADANVWKDVLTHKYTAQKAFMIGGLKVRGNFVLLTRFDALFKLE